MKDDKKRVIVDTDPAIGLPLKDVDDGLAIFLLIASAEVSIRGLTINFGNTTQKRAFKVAKEVLEVAKRNIPVIRGAESRKELGRESAASRFLIKEVKENPGKISLLAIAPLTNVATAIKADSNFAPNLGELVVMGGAIQKRGNIPPTFKAEFNFWSDPEAAKIVLSAPAPKTLIPVDVCQQVVFKREDYRRLKMSRSKVAKYITKNIYSWLLINEAIPKRGGFYPWDVVAAAFLIDKDLFKLKTFLLDVKVRGLERGKVEVLEEEGRKGKDRIRVAMRIERERFMDLFLRRVGSYGDKT